MVELTDIEIDAATERGRIAQEAEPRAVAARFDRKTGRVVVDLASGATFAFPPQLAQGLEEATPDELAEVEISGAGYGLHWERLDADLAVPQLMSGVFGTAKWMARQGGLSKSPAKSAAARENGRKGGRPSKRVA